MTLKIIATDSKSVRRIRWIGMPELLSSSDVIRDLFWMILELFSSSPSMIWNFYYLNVVTLSVSNGCIVSCNPTICKKCIVNHI